MSGDRIPVGVRFFAHVHAGPRAHPASCTMGTGSFPGVKQPGRCADHPPPSGAEVTKGYSYISIHPLGQFRPVTGLLYLYLYTEATHTGINRTSYLSKTRDANFCLTFLVPRSYFWCTFIIFLVCWLWYLGIKCPSSSWEVHILPRTPGIRGYSWNLKAYFYIYKDPPLVCILSKMKPIHTYVPYFTKINLHLYFLSFLSNAGFTTNFLCGLLSCLTGAMCMRFTEQILVLSRWEWLSLLRSTQKYCRGSCNWKWKGTL
jgi:hypothetical protein